jgi:hypothetical protein
MWLLAESFYKAVSKGAVEKKRKNKGSWWSTNEKEGRYDESEEENSAGKRGYMH